MEVTIKKEQVEDSTFESYDFVCCNNAIVDETVKEEPCYDHLYDVGSVKIEAYDFKEPIQECVKTEENSVEISEVYYCYNCDFKSSRKSSLIVHVQVHKNRNVYPCSTSDSELASGCNSSKPTYKYKFTKTDNLKNDPTRTGEKLFYCTVCKFKTSFKSSLNQHMLTHTGEKRFHCTICEYKSSRNATLRKHMLTHTGEKPYQCTICDYKSSRKSTLYNHVLAHTGEKPFQCTICEYKSIEKSTLNKHMLTHTGEKPYQCSICDYKSSRKSTLDKHMLTHTGERPFHCTMCKYKCSRKFSLKKHVLAIHGSVGSEVKNVSIVHSPNLNLLVP